MVGIVAINREIVFRRPAILPCSFIGILFRSSAEILIRSLMESLTAVQNERNLVLSSPWKMLTSAFGLDRCQDTVFFGSGAESAISS